MKTRILIAGLGLLASIGSIAQEVTPEVKTNVIGFVQGVSLERNITVTIAPAFAPDLIANDGKSQQWGAVLSATYHPAGAVGQYTFAGLRLDYLGGEFWAPSVAGGLKADVQLFGFNVTPLVYTGAVFPLSGGGKANGEVGAIVGGGAKATVWDGTLLGMKARLSIVATAEKWTLFPGMVYHVGPGFTFTW